MVGCEVDGPVWVVLGRSWGLCVRSWVAIGGRCLRSGGGLGTYVGDLELLLGLDGRSWVAFGASIGGLGCTWAALGAYGGDLGPLLSLCKRFWAALGAYVGGLGRSWGLSLRSWPLLGPPKAVLGRDQGEKLPRPGKVARTRAGARFSEARIARIARMDRIALGARYQFFL